MTVYKRIRILVLLVCTFLIMAVPPTGALAQEACPENQVQAMTSSARPHSIASLMGFYLESIPQSTDFLVLGDSIANQITKAISDDKSFDVGTILRYSGGGDGIPHAIFRLEKKEAQLSRLSPKTIFLALGTNSMDHFDGCAVNEGFRAYLSKVRALWPNSKMIVLSVIPKGAFFEGHEKDRSQINSFLEESQTAFNYTFLKVRDQEFTCGINGSPKLDEIRTFMKSYYKNVKCPAEVEQKVSELGNPGALAHCSAYARLKCVNFKTDNVHLSKQGLEIIVNRLKEVVVQ